MSYMKATAEVIMLDNQDIVMQAYSENDVKNILKEMDKSNYSSLYNQLMYGAGRFLGRSVFVNKEEGLLALLKDLPDDQAQAVIELLKEDNPSSADTINGYKNNLCSNLSFRDKYDSEEEDSSFDSEW